MFIIPWAAPEVKPLWAALCFYPMSTVALGSFCGLGLMHLLDPSTHLLVGQVGPLTCRRIDSNDMTSSTVCPLHRLDATILHLCYLTLDCTDTIPLPCGEVNRLHAPVLLLSWVATSGKIYFYLHDLTGHSIPTQSETLPSGPPELRLQVT